MIISTYELLEQYKQLTKDVYVHGVLMMIIFEIFTGMIKAFIAHKLNSSISLKGLAKHTSVILVIITFYPYLLFIGFKGVANALILFVIVTYAISITENFEIIGVPIPKFLKKRLEKIKKDIDNKGE